MSIDLYTTAHKSLRLAVSDAAVVIGATEADDLHEVIEPASGVVDELLAHAAHEDDFIQPVLERYLPDLALEIAAQHERLGATIAALGRQLDALVSTPSIEPGGPLALYRAFQRMAAANLLHLDHEETIVMPALWATAPPEALADVMAAFGAAHPEAALLFHRWPEALTPTEQTTFGITATRPLDRLLVATG